MSSASPHPGRLPGGGFLGRLAASVATLAVAATAAAQTTRINPGGGPEEPSYHHSWLVGHGPAVRASPDPTYDTRDDEFASWIFSTNIGSAPHSALLFTMGQCFSSGFLNDLRTASGGDPMGFAAAARWDQCSFSNATGNTWLQPWGQAVDAPHPANDPFLDAYNFATANDPNAPSTFPQYYAFDSDDKTLNLGGGNNNFYLLYVGDTHGRPDFFLDIDQIHRILTTQYGATENDIFAYYGDGLHEDASNAGPADLPAWIDGAGTKANLSGAISNIGGAFVPNDGFFFWSSNHGIESVPEPATVALTGGGLLVLALAARRRRR